MEKLKILHIIDSGGLYGAEMVLLNLSVEQVKMGLDPVIASIGEKSIKEKPLETEAVSRGLKVVKFRMLPGPNPAGMLRVLRYARKKNFDILHSHGYKGNVAFGFIPKKLRKIPLIATLHGYTGTNGFSKNKIYEWLDLRSLKHIDAVALVHKGMLSNPKLSKVKGVKFHVVNNGIPIPVSTQGTQQSQQTREPDKTIISFCQKGFTIGTVGRLSREKGYDYLIEAFSLIVKNGMDARLVILGEGYMRPELEHQVADLGLKDRVLMPGYIQNAGQYIRLFNIYVISSVTEGLPITLLEAMLAKVSVVSTHVGGIPDVLDQGSAGVLIQSSSSAALAKEITRVYDHTAFFAEMAENAYKRLIVNFSSTEMAQNYFSLYLKIICRTQAL